MWLRMAWGEGGGSPVPVHPDLVVSGMTGGSLSYGAMCVCVCVCLCVCVCVRARVCALLITAEMCIMNLTRKEQESPPAWTQEAYHPPCSEYSFCCPNWVPPWPGWGRGTLPGYSPGSVPPSWPGGYPIWVPPGRVPPAGYPPAGYPPGRVPPQGNPPGWTWQGTPSPPLAGPGRVPPIPKVSAPWHSGRCCKALWDMGTPPPPRCEQTNKVKLLPCHRTTYAGGNYVYIWKIMVRLYHKYFELTKTFSFRKLTCQPLYCRWGIVEKRSWILHNLTSLIESDLFLKRPKKREK